MDLRRLQTKLRRALEDADRTRNARMRHAPRVRDTVVSRAHRIDLALGRTLATSTMMAVHACTRPSPPSTVLVGHIVKMRR